MQASAAGWKVGLVACDTYQGLNTLHGMAAVLQSLPIACGVGMPYVQKEKNMNHHLETNEPVPMCIFSTKLKSCLVTVS
jgi:ABC-type antimicrobial peptide transport system ATPase subunit